jgi:hypothetical protein
MVVLMVVLCLMGVQACEAFGTETLLVLLLCAGVQASDEVQGEPLHRKLQHM